MLTQPQDNPENHGWDEGRVTCSNKCCLENVRELLLPKDEVADEESNDIGNISDEFDEDLDEDIEDILAYDSTITSSVLDKIIGPYTNEEKQVAVYGVGNPDKACLLYNKRQRQWYEVGKQLPNTRKEERPQSCAIVAQTFADDDSDADACNSDDEAMKNEEALIHGSFQYPVNRSRNVADLEQALCTLMQHV
eukprot:gene1023-345_t